MTKQRSRKLLNAAEVAELLVVTPRTVREWARQGVLKSLRLGPHARKVVRFRVEDVETFLENAKTERAG